MKRSLSLLALVFGLAGCATGMMVEGPDGYPAIYVRCHAHRMDRCYVKAQRLCPWGYELAAPPGYGALMIRCTEVRTVTNDPPTTTGSIADLQ